MLKRIWNWLFGLSSLNSRLSSIEERLDRIERRQTAIVLYVFLVVTGFSAVVIGTIINDVNDPTFGKVLIGVGLGLVVLTGLTLLTTRSRRAQRGTKTNQLETMAGDESSLQKAEDDIRRKYSLAVYSVAVLAPVVIMVILAMLLAESSILTRDKVLSYALQNVAAMAGLLASLHGVWKSNKWVALALMIALYMYALGMFFELMSYLPPSQ